MKKIDRYTVELKLEEPYAIGERLLDSFAILPHHLLAESYEQGRFLKTWSLATPADQIAGSSKGIDSVSVNGRCGSHACTVTVTGCGRIAVCPQ